MENRLDPLRCFSEAWQAFTVYPWLAIGGIFVAIVVNIFGGMIPLLGIIFSFIIGPVLTLGQVHLSRNIAIDDSPRFEDIFAGFKDFGRSLGSYWLFVLMNLICMLPTIIMFFISIIHAFSYGGAQGDAPQDPFLAFFVVMVANIVIMAFVLMRWSMVFYVVADEPGLSVPDCFRRSAQITFGNRWRLFWLFVLTAVVCFAGLLLLLVGYFVALPLGFLAMARAYFWLKSFHPAAIPSPQP